MTHTEPVQNETARSVTVFDQNFERPIAFKEPFATPIFNVFRTIMKR